MISKRANLSAQTKQYLIITGNYWAFTLTDGALRMLVVLYFHGLGYSPMQVAMLFLFYEIFGVITNLVGGWLGAHFGLNKTMNVGLGLQIAALAMLAMPSEWLSIAYVMAAQALSGIAKDLNKMSAKSAIKLLVPIGKDKKADSDVGTNTNTNTNTNTDKDEAKLYQWVALLTGSKNTLKGIGFFLGGLLLTLLEFQGAILTLMALLTLVWILSLVTLKEDLGKAKSKPKFSELFSKSHAINTLSAARLFLFAARDVWFVVALPVFLSFSFGWDHWWVGGFMASWVIGYGVVQSFAPKITAAFKASDSGNAKQTVGEQVVDGQGALFWACVLTFIPAVIALALYFDFFSQFILLAGLFVFGVVFAINSSLHSYLIISYASSDGVSLDVGFYYMANAMGRLLGTVLSGWVYQHYGLEACLLISSIFIAITVLISTLLPKAASNIT